MAPKREWPADVGAFICAYSGNMYSQNNLNLSLQSY